MDQIGQMRSASELLAQRTLERVLDLVVRSLDVDEVARQVDVDALLSRVDLNAVIEKIDVNKLLSRVDVQALAERIDIDAIVQHTDVGALVVMSSESVTSHAVDTLRSHAVTLDDWIDRWVRRLLRRRSPGLAAPPTLLNPEAGT